MKIELYSAPKLSQSGSGLRKLIQNNDMPVLDLLVRESVQNSLDAKDDSSPFNYVRMEYRTGDFDVAALDKELDGISLAGKPEWGNRFLSIADKNTVGLTGKYDQKSSNLYKLAFGITDAQQAAGAGGSWGIGKTVYFRVAVGMVIYYSRIKKGEGYDSLLTAAFVEDETKDTAILPPVGGQKFGIAWWGSAVSPGSSSIRETHDQKCIDRVLAAFGMKQYEGNDVGTVIIIPFINEKFLLSHNQPAREDGAPSPFWMGRVEDYIKLSVQKWYSARLNNRRYVHGKYLSVAINGRSIASNDMEPFFKLTQALYNKAALTISHSPDVQDVRYGDVEIGCIEIRVNSEINPNDAGQVAYAKVNRKQLGMTVPDNRPSPYEYINSVVDEDDFGRPVLMFCRKPGMVVSYETEGAWVKGIPKSSDDEFVVAWFVLNPAPVLQLVNTPLPLEEYVRKSEMADHSSWDDLAIESQKPTIITKIKKSVSNKLGKVFEEPEDKPSKSENTGLGNLLGRVLLPPEGFGRKPAQSPTSGSGAASASHKDVRFKYAVIEFNPTGMLLEVDAYTSRRKAASFGTVLGVDAIAGSIDALSWESEMGLTLPLVIKSALVTINSVDGVADGRSFMVEKGGDSALGTLAASLKLTPSGDWYGMDIKFADENSHSFDLTIIYDINLRRKDMKPVLSFE